MLDPQFTVSIAEEKPEYSKIVLEPLRQGYGHTIGNALRRILLTSLHGAAITSIKIKGVKHQFSTLKGMSEDVVQIVLNIKTLRVKLDNNIETATLKLDIDGPGEVKASDIVTPVGVTITNPDTVIAHLADKKSKLSMELTVETGEGYSLAEERKTNAIGVIPVDALFSPIKRINPIVSSTRVGRRTDFDKLTLEIWTDGTISGREALNQSAQVLVEHFKQIYQPSATPEVQEEVIDSKYPNETLKLTVEELDLPTRIANALRKGGYKTVGDLVNAQKEEIVKVKNLGERSVVLVENALKQKNVTLSDEQ